MRTAILEVCAEIGRFTLYGINIQVAFVVMLEMLFCVHVQCVVLKVVVLYCTYTNCETVLVCHLS